MNIEVEVLRAVFEHALDGIIVVDDDGRFVHANEAAAGMFPDVAGPDRTTRTPLAFLTDAQRADVVEDDTRRGVWTLASSNGRARRLEYAAVANVVPGRHLCILRDVTELHEKDEAVLRSERRFRALTEKSSELKIVCDQDAVVRYASPAARAILGLAPEELVGKSGFELVHADDLAVAAEAISGLVSRELSEASATLRVQHRDGSFRIVDVVGRDHSDDPNVGGLVINAHDVTERIHAERRAAEVSEQLARVQEQLQQAAKLEAIGRLAGGIAHDFNNLLSVILSYCSFLLDGAAPPAAFRADVEQVQLAGERAAALTRQLLAFSRRQVLEPRVVDVNDVIAGLSKMVERMIGEDIALSIGADDEDMRVHVDRGQLEQVIMNLVVNARDAMPNGGALHIETKAVTLDAEYAASHVGVDAGPYVLIAVSDTGSGMDAATQTRLFEPFFTTKPRGKGTGLGLSTVFGIVRQSGGAVWVYSEVGKGTSMKVYLPRVDAALDDVVIPPELAVRGGSEVVLVTEDDEQVRTVARSILQRAGYTVIEAANAGEALLISEQREAPIDLLLTDVVLPRVDGPTLAARLRLARPTTRVLFMSGYTDDAIQHHGIDGRSFVQKPLTPASLMRRVREALDA